MHKLLQAIRSRPGMYFGDTDKPFTSLTAFVGGYQCGFATARPDSVGSGESELVGRDFGRFVTKHYDRSFPDGGRGWQTFIRERSANEREAFEVFFELFDQYERA